MRSQPRHGWRRDALTGDSAAARDEESANSNRPFKVPTRQTKPVSDLHLRSISFNRTSRRLKSRPAQDIGQRDGSELRPDCRSTRSLRLWASMVGETRRRAAVVCSAGMDFHPQRCGGSGLATPVLSLYRLHSVHGLSLMTVVGATVVR